jgi:hypothetical protein
MNLGKKLDATEEKLLNKITVAAIQGEELLVGDLISLIEHLPQVQLQMY